MVARIKLEEGSGGCQVSQMLSRQVGSVGVRFKRYSGLPEPLQQKVASLVYVSLQVTNTGNSFDCNKIVDIQY